MTVCKATTRQVFWRAVILYLLITGVLFQNIAMGTAGFSYALDQPYVQLALAQHIAHGTYGLNAGSTSAPVASIAWPILLAVFGRCWFLSWMPLLLNAVAALGVCALAGFCVARYYAQGWQGMSAIARWVFALMSVLAANLPSLTLVGMEHTLQVLVAGGCALAIAEAYFGRRSPVVCLACAAAAPALRYEGIAFMLAVCLTCWVRGRRGTAVMVATTSLLPLLAFGLFLHTHGLPFVPASAFTEGRLLSPSVLERHAPGLELMPVIGLVNLRAYMQDPQRWPILAMFLLLATEIWRVRDEKFRRNVLAAATIGLGLLMVLGPYGYFYRLDVPYRFFAFLLMFAVAAEYEWFSAQLALGTGALASVVFLQATSQVATACWETAHGQKQSMRFVRDFYRSNVLVTDPGWVAFDSRDRSYVMNAELVTRLRGEEVRHALQVRGVNLALLSPRITVDLPLDWRRVAVLCRYGDGFNCLTIFRSPAVPAQSIVNQLQAFSATAPSGTWIRYEDGSRSDVP